MGGDAVPRYACKLARFGSSDAAVQCCGIKCDTTAWALLFSFCCCNWVPSANMCGILAAFGLVATREHARRLALKQTRLLRHRGPDSSLVYQTPDGCNFMAHERLNIVDATDRGRCGCLQQRSRLLVGRLGEIAIPCRQPFVIKKDGGNIVWMMCVPHLAIPILLQLSAEVRE